MDQAQELLDGKMVLTVREVSKILRISENKTYEAILHGEIPSIRFGRRVLVPKPALLRLLGAEDMPDKPLRREA